jgi:hypothetical protein
MKSKFFHICNTLSFARQQGQRSWRSAAGAAVPYDSWQIRNLWRIWHGKSRAEIVPKSDAKLCASLIEAKKGVAAVATGIDPLKSPVSLAANPAPPVGWSHGAGVGGFSGICSAVWSDRACKDVLVYPFA